MALKTALGFAGLPGGYLEQEIEGLKIAAEFSKTGSSYAYLQETKPQVSSLPASNSGRLPNKPQPDASRWVDWYVPYVAQMVKVLSVLIDSPVGLLAWIGEKLYAWTDNYPWTPEELITWTML